MICRTFALIVVCVCYFAPANSLADYPADPTADTKWPFSTETSVSDIQSRFNTARTNENNQLGTSVPMLALPSQSDWNAKSDDEKALWLINRERADRGIDPLHGLEANVTQVARDYAQYLLDNDAFSHTADGNTPWQRLNNNPAINTCHDYLGPTENLAVFSASAGGWTLPIERAVYVWMYADSGSNWGHRHAILWYPYNDNSGAQGVEGFLGIGTAAGEHQGWPYVDIIVMNVFDPCSTWDYSDTCDYDLDQDSDVDGVDLWLRARGAGAGSLNGFVQEFGTANCGSQ